MAHDRVGIVLLWKDITGSTPRAFVQRWGLSPNATVWLGRR